MASVTFSGGKMKSSQATKGQIDHILRNHDRYSNQDINPELSSNNIYANAPDDAWQHFRKRLEEIKNKSAKKLRKDAVVAHGITISIPDGVPPEEYLTFMSEVVKLFAQVVGNENIITYGLHVDEIHDYVDPTTKQIITSRPHCHLLVLPVVREKRGDVWVEKLCDKEFSSVKNFNKLNNEIDKMCQKLWHCKFLTNKPTLNRDYKTVEQLKIESAKAAIEFEKEAQAKLTQARFSDATEGWEIEQRLEQSRQQLTDAELKLKEKQEEIKQAETRLQQIKMVLKRVLERIRDPKIRQQIIKAIKHDNDRSHSR